MARSQQQVGRRPSRRFILGKAVREFAADECLDRSAALTLYAVLALPPLAIMLTSILALVGQGPASTDTILEVLTTVAPGGSGDVLSDPIRAVLEHPAAGWTLVIGTLTALWIAAGYVGSFGRALNRIYGVAEGRPGWQLLGWHLLTSVALVVFALVVTLLIVLSGPVARAVGESAGVGDAAVTIWEAARWPVLVVAGIVIIALLCYAAPNVRHPRFRVLPAGSVLALAVAVVASFGFRLFIDVAGRFETNYGTAMAGIVVFVLWLWLVNISLLLGAELNRELVRVRQLVSGIKADRAVQVDTRDDRASHRARDRRHADEARARSLRESWTHGGE